MNKIVLLNRIEN